MNQPISTTSKPLEAIQKLSSALLPVAKKQISPPHRKFYYRVQGENVCYLIQDGHIQLHRTQDGVVIHSVMAPLILGLSNQLVSGAEDFFFTTKTATTFSVLSASQAKNIIESQQLWGFLSLLQAYLIRNMCEYSAKMTALPTYEIIRNQLLNLINEPAEIRADTTAVQYIRERTLLSRSGIMSMLSQLKKGDYIQVDKGYLVGVNHIPLKY